MRKQKIFEAIVNVTGFTPLESDMMEIESAVFGLNRSEAVEKRLIGIFDYYIFLQFDELRESCSWAAHTCDAGDILAFNQSIEKFKILHSDWNYLRVLFGRAKVGKEPVEWQKKQ